MIVLLISGVLGLVIHPRRSADTQACNTWVDALIATGHEVCMPEIVDYELRRELLRIGSRVSLDTLDALRESLDFLEISSAVMLRAAQNWAAARRYGWPTAGDKAIDCDMILISQAELIADASGQPTVVATTNVRHLARIVDARFWRDIP